MDAGDEASRGTMTRRVQTDTEIAGQPLTEGDLIVVGYPSANFDAGEFPDPEEIRIGRRPIRHFAFGS